MARSLRRGPAGACSAACAFALALALAACASTGPPVRLHTLMPTEIAPHGNAAPAGAVPIGVVLEPLRLPVQVDQAQWLVRLPDDSVALLEQERWASPLRDEIRQALLEELDARGIVEARGPGGAAPSRPSRVGIDVRRFESLPGREARIEGAWTIQPGRPGAESVRCEWLLREAAAPGMPALAAAHRRAVVRLADAIGDGVATLQRGAPVACPAPDSP
jgi:uncharacterized protein